jgi:hypothetical protein
MMASERKIPRSVSQARESLARRLEGAGGLVGVGVGAGDGGGFELLVLVLDVGCEAARRAPASHQGCMVRLEVTPPPRRQ